MHTPYEGGQGPCIWTAPVQGRRTGGDGTERPASRKLIYSTRTMRERGGLSIMAVVLVVVMVVVMAAKDTLATPAVTHPHHHREPAGGPTGTTSMPVNHVGDEYLDDALDDWLNNFDTYTFMVKQDLNTHDEEEGEGEDATAAREDQEEEEEEGGKEEAWSAPIAVSVGSKTLLNPHLDYLVTVESLVAEEGSIFLTLSKYNNQTECGVGGLTVEAVMRSTPHRSTAGGGGLVRQSEGQSGGRPRNSSLTALVAFDLQNEGNITLLDTSAWAEVSEDYWWARGRLAGGGMLSITLTPPECGCLSLSTYYALPVGNLTLVVGPQAYPDELQILICMDPLPEAPVLDEYEDEEEEEEEEQKKEDVGEYLQEPSALVAPKTTEETDTEAETEESTNEPPVTPRKRKTRVGGKKRKTKKTRRQMKRQRIRQAGRRQARRQQRQQLRQEDEDEEGEEGEDAGRAGFKRSRGRWKQKRKGKKAWKKLNKNSRRGRRRFHGARQHHGHHEEMNGTSAENMTDHHHHHHHSQHHLLGQNVTEAIQQEEKLIDILLRDEPENSTLEEQEEEEAAVEGSSVTEEEGGGEGGGEEEEEETPRQRRKNRRQRKKMMRKERRKAHHPPGVKFCCKQGVKHKKNILEFNTTSENSPGPCNATSELVSNFANHQFGIVVEACDLTYSKCCSKFTADMWNAIKARKMARRRDRKERRKSRRQDRKHRRQNERRMRKEMMRQSRRQHQVTEGPEEDAERQGEGDAAVE